MRFTKMQGCGNDYIYVNCFEESLTSPQQLAKTVSDRHFGIGSDGLVLIMPSETADCRMRMFNSDGSESEMCGNAIRCVAKYVYDRDIIHKRQLSVETLAGIKYISINADDNDIARTMTVDMGAPITEAADIPVFADRSPVTDLKLTAFDLGAYAFKDFSCSGSCNVFIEFGENYVAVCKAVLAVVLIHLLTVYDGSDHVAEVVGPVDP